MGVQLVAGWNSVMYGGPTTSAAAAFNQLVPHLQYDSEGNTTAIQVWDNVNKRWLMWDPRDLPDSITTLNNGAICGIYVVDDVYWDWAAAVTAQVSGLDVAYVKV
jgi:hypothetical protein